MTDSQYLASIEISEDQSVITGVTLVAVDRVESGDSCQGCVLVRSDACFNAPCDSSARLDS